MAHERIKTEHAGAKNGGGAWMARAKAKEAANRKRRQTDKLEAEVPWEKETLTGDPMLNIAAAGRRSRESH